MRTRDLTTQTGTLDGFLRIPDIECAWRKKQMKNILLFGILTGILLLSGPARFDASQAASDGGRTLTGKWIVEADFYGTPLYFQMELNEESGKLSGKFGGRKLEGTVAGNSIHFVAKDEQGGTEECTAMVQGGRITGTIVSTDADDPSHPRTHTFTASLPPPRRAGAPQRHEFTPTTFYRQFSAVNKPVLTVSPGDTVHTTTVDAGGTDEKGVTRVLGGNPETGPFYVETAMPGDTLVVHLSRLRLNRDWARSEEHTSELQSRVDLVCRLLLEKKKEETVSEVDK